MNKDTQSAINEAYPLRWEADGIGGFGVKLVATTYTYENGKVRERKVFHTFSRETARTVDAEVRAAGGKLSRIVSALKPGAGVVTTRGHVHWVATEYGAVNLFGKSLRERAEALIGIAHPDVRGDLRRDYAETRHVVLG